MNLLCISEKCLADANKYRSRHQYTPLLTLDPELTESAQKWADHLIETNTFKHGSSGENLWASGGGGKSKSHYCASADWSW